MIRALISLLAILGLAATASAAPKVALPAIEGDVNGDMRDDVAAALDSDQLTILGEKEVNRVYDRLNLENLAELSEKQAKKLSTDLEADAVVTAVLAKKGKKKTLKFRLFVNGKKQRGFTVQFKNAKSNKFKTKLRDKLVEKLSGEEPTVAKRDVDDDEGTVKRRKAVKTEVSADEEDPNPKPKKVATKESSDEDEDEDEEDPKRKKKKKKAAASDDDDEDIEETAIEARMTPKHTANRAAARADIGMSFANRSLVFKQRANFPEGPQPFRSSPVPGMRFEAELFPFAFINPDSILAGFGAAAEYDKTLVLNLETTAERGVAVPVNQSAYAFGGRFRFAFGKKPTSPTVTLGFDVGRRRWKADRSKLMDRTSLGGLGSLDLPDTNYQFVAPGLGFRIPIGGFLAFVGYGEAMFVSKAGPIQKAESYGKAKIFGVATDGGFEVIIMNRFAVRAMFEFTQFGYDFQGSGGMLANSRDDDPGSVDVGGATDRSIGGVVTGAVLY
jgi:hypothetical protein